MPTVECTLSYLAEMAERPFFYLYDPPSGTPSRNTRGDRRRVAIHDGRELVPGPQRVRDLFPPEEAERLLGNRVAVINVWKPIRGCVEESPLAVCDARTIAM